MKIYCMDGNALLLYFRPTRWLGSSGSFILRCFCEATVSEHTMLLEGACSRPPPKEANTGPVSGVEIMRKLSKSHTHNESALRIKVHGRSS